MKAQAHRTDRDPTELRSAKVANVAEALGGLSAGVSWFVLTHGQFSLTDALIYLTTQTGAADVSVCTWTAGNTDLEHMADMLRAGQFRSMRWLVDRSFVTRQPAYCAKLRDLFGDECIRTTRTHAKFITIRNEQWDLAVRTSMNLNHNPRMESLEISDDAALCDFIDAQFDGYFAQQQVGIFDAELREEPVSGIRAGQVNARRIYGG